MAEEGNRDEYDQNIKHFVYMYENMKEYKHLKNISSAKKNPKKINPDIF